MSTLTVTMKDSGDFKIKHKGATFNINEFLRNHPGGTNYVKHYKEKEVAHKMVETQHSKSAYYLLREYKQGGRDEDTHDQNEDLELLVDWSKPMLSQVGSLGCKYNEWVSSPVDRQLRLFGNSFLENLTITPWYVVPIVWVPVIIYFIYYGTRKYLEATNESSYFFPVIFYVSCGILLWTLMEYSLHRWIFHIEPSGKYKIMLYAHFAIHGLHHKVPFDTRRLVFPPVPAALLVYIFYSIFSFFIPQSRIFLIMSGTILGYVIYDMIHFYLHYGSPSEDSYFYYLKRYHNRHHFAFHDSGFGISSVLWDKVFGTTLQLKKLAVGIRW